MNEDKSLEMSKFINQNKTLEKNRSIDQEKSSVDEDIYPHPQVYPLLEKNFLFQQKVIEVVI